ncbi:MAG: DUF6055 domain-containing protein [Kiritimatiellia bacterium]|nr:DUF6055 domain-containing protein [Kiritimatiellia bacterium]
MHKAVLTVISLLACQAAIAAGYDFYANTVYPGANLRPDVDLYEVKKSGGGDPLAYERREVDWWPRKGVDIIAVKKGMPLRTWTLRAGPLKTISAGEVKPVLEEMETLEAKQNCGDRFFRRIRGYLYPPASGEFTFVFAADDQGSLFLSTDEKPENKKRIAWNPVWAKHRRWNMFPSQTSDKITLEKGKRYYIEVVHQEQSFGDHVSVGWKGPSIDAITIIDGEFLSGLDGKRGKIVAERKTTPVLGKRQAWSAPGQFEAHLIGFRGMGNTMTSKFGGGDGGPREPGVVLRLPDGRKRFFGTGSFSEQDKTYIMDLYVKEMTRIKKGLVKREYIKRPNAKFPDSAKPGEPGTTHVESEHVVWMSGSQAGSDDDPWMNELEPEKAQWYRDGSIECAEYFWALNEYAGHLMPFWDHTKLHKYQITVPGTKRDGYLVIPGYAGGGYGGCGIKGAGGGPWAGALFHEWGHGARPAPQGIGSGEALADTYQTFPDPGNMKGNHHIARPWRNVFNGDGGYGFTVFYNMTGEDPNWGYGGFAAMPFGEAECVFMTMARTGEQRGMFKDGIRGFGDTVGEYGARLTTFDCELEDSYRRTYFAPTRNWLETVDADKRIYRIPLEEASEPFGINITRLVADKQAGKIVVDFSGLHDPELYSDWRACIIAVSADGTRRYSPMWSKGKMSLRLEPGDLSHWLSVAATPTALYAAKSGGRRGGVDKRKLYSGRHSYRYPWSVQLTGARPGSPRECRADMDDADLLYKVVDSIPAPHDKPAGARLLKKLKALRAALDEERDKPGLTDAQSYTVMNVYGDVQTEIDRMSKGARHPNGGGWVQATATVAPTAYVGPNAMVLDGAHVLDNAIIDEFGVVMGTAVVSGHARVCGQGVVRDKATVGGYSRVWQTLKGEDAAKLMPKRPGAKDVHEFGLWANYAMDRGDSTILEDWYRFAFSADRGYAADLTPVLNGYLYGKPEFVADGEHLGFRFDGKRQHGELCPRVADLGAITVNISLKPEGKGEQAIFDFGCSADDCLVLKIAGNGKPELVATVGGETVLTLAGKMPLATGAWANLRVEIDGKKAVLWVDGKKANEKSTTFRPCDVFPGGGVKRNTIAAARDGKHHFAGVLDQVVIYHAVHADYAGLPEPTLDSPVRPTPDYIAALAEKYGNLKALNAKARAMEGELMAPYREMEKQSKARQQEIMDRSPEYVQAVADQKAAEEALEQRKRELTKAFDKLPENIEMQEKISDARAKNDALRNKINALERKAFEPDEQLVALKKQRDEAETTRRAVEQELRKEFDKRPKTVEARAEIDPLRKQANALRSEVQKLEKDAMQADEELQQLRAKRAKCEADRGARQKVLRPEFDAGEDAAELAGKADDARERRHNNELTKEERDKAAREEDALRRKWNEMWHGFLRADATYNGADRARSELNRPIHERETSAREGVRKNSEVARNYDKLNNKVRELDDQLRRKFDLELNNNERYAAAQASRIQSDQAIRNRQEDLRADLRVSAPIYREQKRAEQRLRNAEQELRGTRELVVGKGAVDLERKVGETKGAVVEAEKVAWKAYGPERGWLYSFNNQGYRGYYNTAYNHYLGGHAKAIVGGGEMREDTNFLEALAKAVSGDDPGWRTKVDWDWRVREEIDGSIADAPLMRKWLERVRGPVMMEKP